MSGDTYCKRKDHNIFTQACSKPTYKDEHSRGVTYTALILYNERKLSSVIICIMYIIPQENYYIAKYPTLLIKYYIVVYPPQIVRIWFEFYYFLKISGVSKMGDNELYSKNFPPLQMNTNIFWHFL